MCEPNHHPLNPNLKPQVRFFETRKLVRRLVAAERALASQANSTSKGEEEEEKLKARYSQVLADLEVGCRGSVWVWDWKRSLTIPKDL
jgi:hypothetical protein